MGYYVRAYCKTKGKPSVQQLLDHLNDSDYGFDVSSNLSEEEAALADWTSFELIYDEDRAPILVDYNGLEDEDGLLKLEIPEVVEEVEAAEGDTAVKQSITAHLHTTTFAIVSELDVADIDDEGYSVNGELLNYITAQYNGLIYADGEGFYEGDKLIFGMD